MILMKLTSSSIWQLVKKTSECQYGGECDICYSICTVVVLRVLYMNVHVHVVQTVDIDNCKQCCIVVIDVIIQ